MNSHAAPMREATTGTPTPMYCSAFRPLLPRTHSSSGNGYTPISISERSAVSRSSDQARASTSTPSIAKGTAPTTSSRIVKRRLNA